MNEIDQETKQLLIKFQVGEITENIIYKKLSKLEKDENNRKVLEGIAVE